LGSLHYKIQAVLSSFVKAPNSLSQQIKQNKSGSLQSVFSSGSVKKFLLQYSSISP